MKKIAFILLTFLAFSCSNNDDVPAGLEQLEVSTTDIIEEANGTITINSIGAERVNTRNFRTNVEFFGMSNPVEINLSSYRIEAVFTVSSGGTVTLQGSSGDLDNQITVSKEDSFFSTAVEGDLIDLESISITITNTNGEKTKYTREIL